jgi:hypothetical protein
MDHTIEQLNAIIRENCNVLNEVGAICISPAILLRSFYGNRPDAEVASAYSDLELWQLTRAVCR